MRPEGAFKRDIYVLLCVCIKYFKYNIMCLYMYKHIILNSLKMYKEHVNNLFLSFFTKTLIFHFFVFFYQTLKISV